MDSWGTILMGYGGVFGVVAVYAYSVVRRGRAVGEGLGLGGKPSTLDIRGDHVEEDNDERR